MGQAIHIVTDSSSDLSPPLQREFDISVVPLSVHFGKEVYQDGELSVQEFWDRAAGPVHPKTSQPSIGAFAEAFAPPVARGKQVLYLAVTSKHSGTFNAAQLAAQRFQGAVTVFDSHSLSIGLGLQAVTAAQAVRVGRTMQEIVAQLEDMRARMRLLILFDTLEYLRHGGRADAFMAAADRMTRALNIRVIINVVEGQLRLLSAARSFRGGLRRMMGLIEEMAPLEHLAVAHARNQQTAEEVADQLAERTGFSQERVWIEEIGAVLAAHAGPGVIGMLAVPSPTT